LAGLRGSSGGRERGDVSEHIKKGVAAGNGGDKKGEVGKIADGRLKNTAIKKI